MPQLELDGATIFYREDGDLSGVPVVFSNSLGTDLSLWDPILPHLPDGLRIVRYDKRGHGQSTVPDAPYSMGRLVRDVEQLMDHLEITNAMFVGLSIGGLIGQGLACKRLDLVRAMVLSNTAAKIGTQKIWQDRIDAIRARGLEAVADATMERWFSRDFIQNGDLAKWRGLFTSQPAEGYIGCSMAIANTDFYTSTSGLRLPVLGIAGSEDGATPPDLMRETINLVPGSRLELMRRVGHLPCVEAPEAYASLLTDFFRKTGHI